MTPATYERSAPIGRPLFNQPVLFRPWGTGARKNRRNDPPAAAPSLSTVAASARAAGNARFNCSPTACSFLLTLTPTAQVTQARAAGSQPCDNRRSRTRGGCLLVADDLLAQDVGVPAMLSELAQHVEIYPPQRKRAAPVAANHVVQPQR